MSDLGIFIIVCGVVCVVFLWTIGRRVTFNAPPPKQPPSLWETMDWKVKTFPAEKEK